MTMRNATRKGMPIERKANRPSSYNKFTVDPKPPKTWLDTDFDELSYFPTNEFKAYCIAVSLIVTQAKDRGASIAEIHRALGDEARPEWTLDALEHLDQIDSYQRGALRAWRLKEFTYAIPDGYCRTAGQLLVPERSEVTA